MDKLHEEMEQFKKDRDKEREQHASHLKRTIAKYEDRLREAMANHDKMKDMFLRELMIKDSLIKQSEGAKERYRRLAKELNTKLKIPRHHLEFLHQKGTLDHFVSAKICGDDLGAKWSLIKAGLNEIKDIEHQHHVHRIKEEKEQGELKRLRMYGLENHVKENEEKSLLEASSIPGSSFVLEQSSKTASRL